jgi:hypothetical protein
MFFDRFLQILHVFMDEINAIFVKIKAVFDKEDFAYNLSTLNKCKEVTLQIIPPGFLLKTYIKIQHRNIFGYYHSHI